MSQTDADEQAGSIMSRFFTKFKKSDQKDGDKAAMQPSSMRRKSIVRFSEMEAGLKGPGVANQLKSIKDADAASAAQKAKEAEEKRKQDRGEVEEVNTQILPVDIDRWMPDHWLRSQYLEDVVTGPDSDMATRADMVQRYIDEETTVSKNASTAFKFGFSKTVRMKMEQDALAAQRLADVEKMKEMRRNRLDTATVFDVKHDFFCRGLPSNQPDYLQKVKLLASNWYQRLAIRPPTPSTFATVALVGIRKSRMDWGAVFSPRGADAANRDGLGFLFMGALEGGLPHTFGEIHFENGDIYQGEFKGGRYRSIDEVTCGDYYEGYFVNSSKSGIGAYTFGTAKAKYIGEFVNNKFCGFGVYTSRSEIYRGTFVNDERHGRGVAVYNPVNGCIRESLYVGDFKNGRRHGLGRLSFVNCSTWALFHACSVFRRSRADAAGRYFGEFCNGHMHGVGALSCFDGCKVPAHFTITTVNPEYLSNKSPPTPQVYGTWHLGRRHGHFFIQRPMVKDCKVILYDTDAPVWSRCVISMDTTNLLTPSVGVMVKVENQCTEIEAACEEKLFYFSERVKKISEHLRGSVLETVKACVEQARFHACQHTLFNLCFGISGDDVKVIRVDGERKNVYIRDYDLFSQGVDDDTTAAAAKDVTTTQKIARIVQRLQKSIAQGAEPEKIARKSKAELQAEETAKAAEVASNDLEAAIYQYGDMLKKPQVQMMDKLVLLLTTLKHVPSQAKLTADHVFRLSAMQNNDADSLKVIRHFMTASDGANNVDHMGRTFVPSGKRSRGVKRQRKELVALSLIYFEKFRRVLLNIALDDALKEDALNACEQAREWAYYCDLADKNDLSRFRTFVNVKNYFAAVGKVVLAPCGTLPAGSIAFDDGLANQYTAAMTRRGSDNAREVADDDRPESSGSDDSVDFSLQMRRFLPMSIQEMHRPENFVVEARPAPSRNTAAAISDSDSSSDGEGHPAGYPTAAARAAAPTISPTTPSARIVLREFSRTLSPSLSFSPMKTGSVTQRAARAKDKALYSSGSDDAS